MASPYDCTSLREGCMMKGIRQPPINGRRVPGEFISDRLMAESRNTIQVRVVVHMTVSWQNNIPCGRQDVFAEC